MAERYVITLGRECGAGATYIAQHLSKELGIPYYDKDIFRMVSDKSGVLEEFFHVNSEHPKNNLLYKLIKNLKLVNPTARILAEKVETESDFEEILDNKDYSYYQGYYFSRPIIVAGKDVPVRNITYFKVMSELTKDDFNVDSIEKTIKLDVGISFKLFKLLNSSAFSFDNKIKSIKQAIMILGREELNKWITVAAMSEMESANSEEMTRSNIIRGKFCENIAKKINFEHSSECFMAGLFSNLDKYMQKHMDKVVSELPISDLVKEALTKRNNIVGYILTLAESYENMQIEKIDTYAAIVGIDKNILVELYFESIEWTKMVLFE